MLTLYHHGSSACAAKVRFALEEKGLDWEGQYIDLMRGEQFSPEYLALNPKGVVPTLVHDGTVVRESTVICEYLDEVFPDPPLMPADPAGRAEVRIWTKAVDEELHPACSALTYVVSHRHTILQNGIGSYEEFLAGAGAEGMLARERKWQWLKQGLDAPGVAEQVRVYAGYINKIDAALEDRRWLIGDAISLADIALAPYLFRLSVLGMDALWQDARLARVSDWYRRLAARPGFEAAFVRWLPEELGSEMRANGTSAWPQIRAMLGIEASQ